MNSKKKKSGFFGFFYRLLLWIALLLGIMSATLIGIAAFYENGVGTLVINELKKTLKTELYVESAELSLIWNFPKASVTLKNVKLKGVGQKPEKDLLNAESISLNCGIFGLITGSYKFDQILIKNASIFVYIDKYGKVNYDILKPANEKNVEDPNLDLSIINAYLMSVNIEYKDEKLDQNLKMKIMRSNFSGNFTEERYDMKSKAEIISDNFSIGNDVYFKNKSLSYDAVIDIDNKSSTYNFKKFDLDIEGNKLATEGNISYLKEGLNFNLKMGSEKVKLKALLRLLPKSFEKSLGGFESNANMMFDANIQGIYSNISIPKTDLKLSLKDGKILHPQLSGTLKSVSFDVSYRHPGGNNKKDGIFSLKNFEGKLSGNPVDFVLDVKGTENPYIDFNFNGKIPLKAIYKFAGKNVNKGKGIISLDKISLKGKLNDIVNPRRISQVELQGNLSFEEAGLTINDVPIQFYEGNIRLKDNVLDISKLLLKSTETELFVDGSFENLLPVLFSDSTNSKSAELGFDFNIKSEKIDADELLKAFSSPIEYSETDLKTVEEQKDSILAAKNTKREYITQFFKGNINADIKEIKYGKIIAKKFKGRLLFENNVLNVMGLRADVFKGNVGLNAKIHFEKEPYMEAFFDSKKVDMYELLDKTDNFSQSTLTSKNLRGQLNSVIKIDAFWDSTGAFDYKKLYCIADVNISKGELIDFEIFESMGKYVKLKDLQRIRFNELNNQLYIKDGKLYIPAMFIQSNAINLTLAGYHGFDQEFDYKFKINAGQVIARKMKKHNPRLPMVPAKRKGIFNIYLSAFGNVAKEDYNFKIGKKYARKQLESDLNREIEKISNTLKSEFEKTDLFGSKNTEVKSIALKSKINSFKEPEDWKDTQENDLEYIDGF